MADPEGVQWVLWNPSLKGSLRKYAQTYYVHYAHTGATHFSFTVAITHDLHVSTPVSRIRRVHDLRARIYYQKHMATIETMSEARERIEAKVFYSCNAPSAARDGDMLSV